MGVWYSVAGGKTVNQSGLAALAFNQNSGGRGRRIAVSSDQPGLQSEYQESQNHMVKNSL